MPRQQTRSRNVPQLPNELITAIFNACSLPDRVVLLRCSKRFSQVGLRSLYRSVWIKSSTALQNLSETLSQKPERRQITRSFDLTLVEHIPSSDTLSIQKAFKSIISSLKKVEILHLYAPALLEQQNAPTLADIPFPASLTSYSLATQWRHVSDLNLHLNKLSSLQNLSIKLPGKSPLNRDLLVTLPNLLSYHGPPFLLQSLAQGSKNLSSLVIEELPSDTTLFPIQIPGPMPLEEDLKFLKQIGSPSLSYLQITFSCPAVANIATQFLPNVEHVSLLCTDGVWIVPDTLDPWNGRVSLDFLSRAPSLSKFSLSFLHVLPNVPWDLAIVAETLGRTCPSLLEVNTYGYTYRKSLGATDDTSTWTLV